jgi:hypothetical protein
LKVLGYFKSDRDSAARETRYDYITLSRIGVKFCGEEAAGADSIGKR